MLRDPYSYHQGASQERSAILRHITAYLKTHSYSYSPRRARGLKGMD